MKKGSKGGRKTKRAEDNDGDDKAGIGQRGGYELEVGCKEEKMEEMRKIKRRWWEALRSWNERWKK
jgi:hypothetical protein